MAYTFRPPQRATIIQRQIAGVRDSRDFASIRDNLFSDAVNVYPYHIAGDAAWLGRPGFSQMGGRLGSGDARRVQWLGEFPRLDGSRSLHAVCAGRLYTYNWGTQAWTELAGGAHFSTTARVYHAVFADRLILTDGVNKPKAFDGTTLTTLTNAPVAYGKPVVHFAKLFFINAAVRNEIQWSEENQPNLGYAVGGYNNAWVIAQTDTNPFFAMFPYEEQLLLFRARSITAIYGAVTTDFRSTGVREAVSTTVGTTSPDSLVDTANGLWFVDAEMRPHIFLNGRGVREAYTDAQVAIDATDNLAGGQVVSTYDRRFSLVIMGLVKSSSAEPNQVLVFEEEKAAYCGKWEGFRPVALASAIDQTGTPRIIHASTNGFVYLHGSDTSGPWNDENATEDGGTKPILHRIVGAPLGYNMDTEIRAQRCDMIVRFNGAALDMDFRYETPRGRGPNLQIRFQDSGDQWNLVLWDTAIWGGQAFETKRTIGVNPLGRWMRPELVHERLGQQFGWVAWSFDVITNNRQWQVR